MFFAAILEEVEIIFKANQSLNFDKKVDLFLIEKLRLRYPEALIVSEEVTGKRALNFASNPYVLCIDPIDGSSLVSTGLNYGPMWCYFKVSELGKVLPIETVIHHIPTKETIYISNGNVTGTIPQAKPNEKISIADGRSLRKHSHLNHLFNAPQNGQSIVSTALRVYHYSVSHILQTEGEIWDVVPLYALLNALGYKTTDEHMEDWKIQQESIPTLVGQIN